MHTVLDANIIVGLFRTSYLGHEVELTASPLDIFKGDSIGQFYVDDGGHILGEWQDHVDGEWLHAWYTQLLIEDVIVVLEVPNYPQELRYLVALGFPKRGGDKWYIRTALAVCAKMAHSCYLVTEDIDFFLPKLKKSASAQKRIKILQGSNSRIQKYLGGIGVKVRCTKKYLEERVQ